MRAELIAKLGLSTTAFEQGLASAASSAKQFRRNLSQSFSGQLGTLIAPAALAAVTKQAIDYGDAIHKAALRTGISTEEMQKLGRAAELSGASLGEAQKAVMFMNRTIAQQPNLFAKWGIDTAGKSQIEVVNQIANAVKNLGDEAQQTAMLHELMGRGSANLLPMFLEGREGIDKMTEGMTLLEKQTIESMAAMQDAMTRTKGTLTSWAAAAAETALNGVSLLAGGVAEMFSRADISEEQILERAKKLRDERVRLYTDPANVGRFTYSGIARAREITDDDKRTARRIIIEERERNYAEMQVRQEREKNLRDLEEKRLAEQKRMSSQEYNDWLSELERKSLLLDNEIKEKQKRDAAELKQNEQAYKSKLNALESYYAKMLQAQKDYETARADSVKLERDELAKVSAFTPGVSIEQSNQARKLREAMELEKRAEKARLAGAEIEALTLGDQARSMIEGLTRLKSDERISEITLLKQSMDAAKEEHANVTKELKQIKDKIDKWGASQ